VARKVLVNRAPVLALWASVVAERLGHDRDTALSLARVVTGLTAQSKGRRLGLFEERPKTAKEVAERRKLETVELLDRTIPVTQTPDGLRAVDKGRPVLPESVTRYLETKFGEDLGRVRAAMEKLARSLPPDELAGRAFALYVRFRPKVPEGTKGWGAKGELVLGAIEKMAAGESMSANQ
jgi:hypothetical protein